MAVSDPFWESFFVTYGRGSTFEAQFLGYLTTQGISPFSTPTVLTAALAACTTFLAASVSSVGTAGPGRVALALQEAMETLSTTFAGETTLLAQASREAVLISPNP